MQLPLVTVLEVIFYRPKLANLENQSVPDRELNPDLWCGGVSLLAIFWATTQVLGSRSKAAVKQNES